MPQSPDTLNHGISPMLTEVSAANIASITDSYADQAVVLGYHTTRAETHAALVQAEAAVQAQHALTINMSPRSIQRFLTTGRLETFWDHYRDVEQDSARLAGSATANGKALHDDYVPYRRTADDALREYAPGDAQAHEPVFAALAGPDEMNRGAAPEYGNWWITLPPAVASRAVYNFADSHASVSMGVNGEFVFDDSTLLTYEDALKAKVVAQEYDTYTNKLGYARVGSMVINADPNRLMSINGRAPGYIEAAVFDEITTNNVASINAMLQTPEQLAQAAALLHDAPPELTEKLRIVLGSDVEPLTRSWLTRRFVTEPLSSDPDQDPTAVNEKWEALGLSEDSSYEEIVTKLREQAENQWRALSRRLYGGLGARPQLMNFRGGTEWHNYLARLRREGARLNGSDKKQLAAFIATQQARAFFV